MRAEVDRSLPSRRGNVLNHSAFFRSRDYQDRNLMQAVRKNDRRNESGHPTPVPIEWLPGDQETEKIDGCGCTEVRRQLTCDQSTEIENQKEHGKDGRAIVQKTVCAERRQGKRRTAERQPRRRVGHI